VLDCDDRPAADTIPAVWRAPILIEPTLPTPDDPAIAEILKGLVRATGAHGCALTLSGKGGEAGHYRVGDQTGSSRLVLDLEVNDQLRGVCELHDAGGGPAASPRALDSLRPVLEGALAALIERSTVSHQAEILANILGLAQEPHLLLDGQGDIVYANAPGEELLALHTRHPNAHVTRGGPGVPLLHLIGAEIVKLRQGKQRLHQQELTTGDGQRWRLEIVAVGSLAGRGYSLVVLTPLRLPTAPEIRARFAASRLSPREAEVLSLLVAGGAATEIARALRISAYTVKDHLKHAYGKLGIRSRGQLLSLLAATAPTPV
jgi:DNA-binding CsgD family transcriptional regulator